MALRSNNLETLDPISIFPGNRSFALHDNITVCGLDVLREIKI